ncbi:SusC/RagA family TonB-linked outer membrane protein [Niastella yeongjuensis]|uniref:SusC/RagA family TonB-linked outer membrane protein n=1 Tax=Niastella yeongjuensis TaxID=354355 RepID=A0A1V9E3V8_9BACT|nr:TonB-dependent receptor [Niastella yeongjuensis]OQP40817.1 SusC/RagA family TonB-linked outer membrane protein [Niastella yeongjuensis]SEP00769.1 TonB-linked outer membrane protein, SusC/RagA family [Niastella yeongjuensis]
MNRNRQTKTILIITTFILAGITAYAQQPIPIKGTIRETGTQKPVPGVSVKSKHSRVGTSTDENGQFSLTVPSNDILLITAIGHAAVEQPVNGKQFIEITLAAASNSLGEVVVVGYGAQSKKSLVSAVATIKADEIKNKPVAAFDQQLQGRVAGVQVSANTGIPGDGIFFRIRGTTSINAGNDPLYVVDGVFINNQSLQKITTQGQSNNPLADINPADIESISVLKDASATAIYGARAANGVILITTKRGQYNTQAKVNANAYYGSSWAPQLWDLVTGPEHATIINEAWANDGKSFATRPFRPKSEGGRGLPEEQPTYDRLHDIFRTGNLQNYDLSVSGGNDKTRYYIGGGYNKQQAILRTNDFQRASFKFNLDQQINSHVRIGSSNLLSRSYRTNARVGDGPQGGILQAALHTPTYLPKFNDDGTYAKWAGFDNLDVLIKYTDMHSTSIRYIGNIYGEADLVRNLKFRTSWSIDYNDYNEYEYWNSLTNRGSASKGLASSSVSKNAIWITEQTLSYKAKLGQHGLGLLAGNSVQGTVETVTSAQGTNFPNDSYKQIASAATTTSSSSSAGNRQVSVFGRLEYNYAGKYFAEFNVRGDASSKFGTSKQWGYFPSVGLAWLASEEPFIRNINAISTLKLRANIGITGNQNGIGNFASRNLWNGGANYLDNPGTVPQQLGNTGLSWETTRQTNLGIDLGLLQDRINIEFNLYKKYTTDLLLSLPLPVSTGFSSVSSNAGEISNKGFELGITTTNISNRRFTWTTSFNIAHNVNKIEKLDIPVDASYSAERMLQGYSMHSFYVYKQLYVDPQTGDAVYEDYVKDGKITADDRQIVGNAQPRYFGGINNSLRYQGFDFSIFFNFQFGNKIFNNNRFFHESGGTRDDRRAINKNQLNRWQKPGDITEVPRITTLGTNYTLSPVSRFIEDGSFIRLSTLTLGYTLPQKLTTRIHTNSIRIYASGSNWWLWKKYQGPDPEINVTSDPNVQGYDLGTPPQPRTIQFGINLSL